MNFFEKITNNLKKKDFVLIRLILLISAAALAVLFCVSQNPELKVPFDIESSKEFKIIIPKIDLSEKIYEGKDEETLNKGPAHYPETAFPEDESGNVVISGHSAETKEHDDPFARLDELEKGDLIQLTKDGNIYEYKVTQTKIVASTKMSVIKPTQKPTLTLITCIKPDYPRDKRLIVKAERVAQEIKGEKSVADFNIEIPKLNIKAPVVANVDGYNKEKYFKALERGVAHLQGTALPGEIGNLVIFGHSSFYPDKPGDYKEIFKNLQNLGAGDTIYLKYNHQKDQYLVSQKEITNPKSTQYLDQTKDQQLTLITCVPPGTTKYRLIIIARPKSQ